MILKDRQIKKREILRKYKTTSKDKKRDFEKVYNTLL